SVTGVQTCALPISAGGVPGGVYLLVGVFQELRLPGGADQAVFLSTVAGMNSAGFFFAMSTTWAYLAVMRGSAWPRKSCTARRSPVCKYPSVPAVWRRAWLETPGRLSPVSRKYLSVC